ncbi:MAG: hypothetical protein DMD26_00050 [Gemmatimonadetes bacterium]|nr:MAG: hypothetical protein DMD26_00050 [Gemmatimonadota bacterium]
MSISLASWSRSKRALHHRTSPRRCARSVRSGLRCFAEGERSRRSCINPARIGDVRRSCRLRTHHSEGYMKRFFVLSLVGLVVTSAGTAAAQATADSARTMKRAGTPDSTSKRVNLKVKVDANVAAAATVSADSAQAIALAQIPEGGKVNSGELHMEDGKLVYDVNVVPNGKKTVRMVRVDAMTGAIVKDTQYGGVKGVAKKHAQHEKEEKAQKSPPDSAKKP